MLKINSSTEQSCKEDSAQVAKQACVLSAVHAAFIQSLPMLRVGVLTTWNALNNW